MNATTAIVVVAAITLASRLAGPVIAARLPLTHAVERTLDGLAHATLAALLAVTLARSEALEQAAVVAAIGVALLGGGALGALGTGVALAAMGFHLGF